MPTWILHGWAELGVTAAKVALMYLTALLGLRIASRRTLAQWTAIDFAAAVAIGAIIGRTATAGDQSFAVGAVALLVILAAHWIATMGKFSPLLARLFDHRVRVLAAHGRLRADQLRKCGLTRSEVLTRLRQQGVGDLGELRYVMYEAKGELTIVPERGTTEPDSELVCEGLHDAAGHSPDESRQR
jgi:uncharacterized membrane protein YcaP (DUF421 family)